MKKYNMSEIMKKAWVLFKGAYGNFKRGSFAKCLKRAWEVAKMSFGMKTANNYFDHYFTNHGYDEIKMETARWCKYGKDRTYINAVAYNNGQVVKTYKVGYVDNMSDEFFATK